MRRWVVTGPAGGGKSTLCRFLENQGAVILDGDLLGHEILVRQGIVADIAAEFGPGVVNDGLVDRAALGSLVFSDPLALDRLNRITHGPLSELAGRRLDKLATERRHSLAVLEAAVYFLLPPVPGIELVVTVTAPVAIRLARLTASGALSDEEATSRIEAQEYMTEGWLGADVVLVNDGSLSVLKKATAKLWSSLED